jgi:HEAT repeat protein
MDATRRPVTEVERAVQAHKRAIARLIRLLKHEDESVRSGAAAALKGLDAPPTFALGEALLGSRDTDLRLRIIRLLVALAEVDQVRVLYILCEAFKERRDLAVKRAVAMALLVLVTERSGQYPFPGRVVWTLGSTSAPLLDRNGPESFRMGPP